MPHLRLAIVATVAGALVGLAACGPVAGNHADVIPKAQIATVVESANTGDLAAIKRLIAHYEAMRGGEAQAALWKSRARDLGDPEELNEYAETLFEQSKVEADPTAKRRMRIEALRHATRAYSRSASSSSQQLINEINSALLTQP